jgi:hypothetical protein
VAEEANGVPQRLKLHNKISVVRHG